MPTSDAGPPSTGQADGLIRLSGDHHHRLRAVTGHATSFWTWRSLCIDHGLPDTRAVDAMTGMILALIPGPQAEPADGTDPLPDHRAR